MAEDKTKQVISAEQEGQEAQSTQPPSSASLYKTEYGMIRRAPIIQEMEKSYLDYAMSVIVSRALPDVRDGLKPVHRRILYAMRQMGIHWNTSYKKSARIVGEVLGKFHPHGDSAVYDALVRLAQDFSMRYQLIDGQGNFGCFTGDTKVRLADGTTKSFFELIDDHTKGITHFTYTVDQKNAVQLAPINVPRLTQKNASIIEVALDNGERIRCTPNHKFMIRDGSYVEAQHLSAGQALMPLYTRLYNGEDKNLLGYEETYQPATQTYEFTHRLADAYNLERKKIPHNLIPRFSWGVQHFSHGIAEVLERLQQSSTTNIYLNHKVVSVHPAGNADVYDLTVDTTHNFALAAGVFVHNSVDGDSAAAMRYTEARLSRISEELLTDIEKETVDFIDTFDGSQQEPTVLPSKLPNLLLMGAEGIAVGMATKIPPHNLNEVSLALLATIEHGKTGHLPDTKVPDTEEGLQAAKPAILAGTFDSEITIDQLMEHIKGPDFPTGGIMYDWNQIKETYALGKGRVVVRAVASIEEQKNGKFQIIITELPYQVNKSKLVAKIAQLVRDKKVVGISDLRDESDRDGLRVVVDLKKDAKPKAVLNNLYKYTELQSSFSMNMVALNAEGTPQLMNVKIVLTDYIRHRQLVVVRRSQYELKAARDRAHILEGLLIALNHLDEVIETIRKSPDSDTAKQRLMDKFKLSAIQAVAILDMQLRRLAALERQKIEDEYKLIKGIIKDLCTLLSHPQKVLDVIIKEAKEVMDQFGDERRTKLHKGKIGEFSEEDLIANEPAIITVTETGYIKRMSPSVYRPQQRGGVGVTGMTTKEEDAVMMILVANTHDSMLMLTNKGRVFKLKVHELPESGRQAKGTSVVNLINLQAEERLQTILTMNDKEVEEKYIALATKNGLVKKTKLADYQNIRTNGIIAIILKDNDELVWGKITSGKDHIMLITHEGKSIRFPEGEIKVTARDTQGVRAIMLREQDYVVGVEAFPAKFDASDKKSLHQLLLVTQNGMGKRTELSEYPVQKRAGQGVKVAEITKKTGNVTGAMMVEDTTDEVVLTTKSAQVIKLALKNIPVLTRPTQGVILMRFSEKDDQVVAVTTTRATEVGEK